MRISDWSSDVCSSDLVEAAIAAACGDDAFDCELLRRIVAVNAAWGTKTGLGHADVIGTWLKADPAGRAASLVDLLGIGFTKEGKLRAIQKGQLAADPDYEALCARLGEMCGKLLDLRARAELAEWLGVTLREIARAHV